MSIILSNGVTLPDIPSEVLAEYPFATIYSLGNDNEVVGYFLYAATSIFGHVNKGVIPSDNGEYELVGSMTNGTMRLYSSSTTGWYVGAKDELSAGSVMVPVSEVQLTNGTIAKYTLVWSNHDILNITSIDMETGEYRTGDVYFWKSGEENVTLPPIPAELKNRYGFYGIVRRTTPIDTRYFVAGAPTPGAYVTPEQVGENYGALFCKSKTGHITYKYVVGKSTDWELVENPPYGNGWSMVGTDGIFTMVITDANADIYYAATYDPDTEDITYSSEVYFAKTISDEVEKFTRFSIGRSLMDGYAKEVQRLTGITDQMNAVQIREKLAAVRTRINIGGESLPPIPDDILANYPYVVVLKLTSNVVTGAVEYRLCASTSVYAYVPEGVMAGEYGNYKLIGTLTDAKIANCYNSSATEWGNWNDHPAGSATYVLSDYQQAEGVTVHTAVVWANHDIYEITSLDMSTGDFTVGGIYFSERQNYGNLCLPKLPHEIASEYPYAVLLKVIMTYESTTKETYQLLMATTQFGYIDKGMLTGTVTGINAANYEWVGSMTKGWSATFSSSSTEWDISTSGVSAGNAMMMLGASNLMETSLVWANHDVYEITSLDMTTGDYTMGDRYYPVFADVDDERVSIGYDLFNDIVEQIQRLSNNEEKMDALRAYWKLTTVAAVVTVTEDNTNSGIVIDGVSFPDLPEVNFPYAFIAYHTAGYYYLQYSREPYYADYWKTNSTTANPYYKYSSTSVYYDENDGRIFRLPSAGIGVESIWADYTNESSGMALISYNNKNTQVVWSNYDIYFNYPDNTIAFHSSV